MTDETPAPRDDDDPDSPLAGPPASSGAGAGGLADPPQATSGRLARWRHSGRYPAFIRAEALHESAHATIAVDLGVRVDFATLNLTADGYGVGHPFTRMGVSAYANTDELRRAVVATLAGPAVERRGRPVGTWPRRGGAPGANDRDNALALAERLAGQAWLPRWQMPPSAVLDRLWPVAVRLVRIHANAIDRVARALLASGTLTGDQVRAITQETP